MSPSARKRALRERFRVLRADRPPSAAAASAAAAIVVGREEFVSARCIALYAALPDELSTADLFEAARRAGKDVVLPRIAPGDTLAFVPLRSFEDLRPGRYGVPEPPAGGSSVAPLQVDLSQVDLVVVPGVAFDRTGGRLGRGGGHYDRALAGMQRPPPWVVGFVESVQVVEEVPTEPFDQRVDALATEREWIRCVPPREESSGRE